MARSAVLILACSIAAASGGCGSSLSSGTGTGGAGTSGGAGTTGSAGTTGTAGASGTTGAGGTSALPQGNSGIASKHAGDVGIGSDPDVIFADDFENYTRRTDLNNR